MTKNEKRRSTRRRHNSAVEIYDESGNFITGIGRLVDFSDVGACFSTPKKFELRDRLRIRLRLLREGRLYIVARVVRIKRQANTNQYGIEFEKVHDVA